MKRIISIGIISVLILSCASNVNSNNQNKTSLDCKNSSIEKLENDNSQDCWEIKGALMNFNTKARFAFHNDLTFNAYVHKWFNSRPYNMSYTEIGTMMDGLGTSFRYTGDLIKMIQYNFNNDKYSLYSAFASIQMTKADCETLSQYTIDNF